MAKSKQGRLNQPSGDVVTISDDERKAWRDARVKNGWSTRFLAERVPCSNGTISNYETGKSSQIKRVYYVELARIFKTGKASLGEDKGEEALWKDVVDKIAGLDSAGLAMVQAFINAAILKVGEKK